MNDNEILEALGVSSDTPEIKPVEKATKCRFCKSQIDPEATVCPVCLRDQVKRRSAHNIAIHQSKEWSPGAAAVMSLLIPGLGQIYKGQIAIGLCWLICVPLGYLLILPGLIAHVCCIYNAYNAPKD